MPNSPTTFRGEPAGPVGPDWQHAASLHRADDGGGLLGSLKAVRHGTLADLVRFIVSLPEAERQRYVIIKDGARQLAPAEIMALAHRGDFPKGDTG